LHTVKLTKPIKRTQRLVKRTNGEATLIDSQSADSLYTALVGIGTPPQIFNLQLDTGSSDLWVNGPNSNTLLHPKLNTAADSTYKNLSIPWKVVYGDDDNATGFVGNTSVNFAGFTQTCGLALAETLGGNLDSEAEDGLLGLGFQDLAVDGATTFFENVLATGTLDNPYYSLFLERQITQAIIDSNAAGPNSTGGEICIGCVNKARYSGDIKFTTVTTPDRWVIPADGWVVNGKSVAGTAVASLADSGTSNILVPVSVANALASASGATIVSVAGGQYLEFPSCDALNKISFAVSIGGVQYSIDPLDLLFGEDSNGACVSRIGAQDETEDDQKTPLAILGDAFLKNVISVYTYETNGDHQIGFAPSVQNGTGNGGSSSSNSTGSGSSDPSSPSGSSGSALFRAPMGLAAAVVLGGLACLI